MSLKIAKNFPCRVISLQKIMDLVMQETQVQKLQKAK